jgi:hypothetical protein
MLTAALAASALAGLASVPHCAAMCGPLATYSGAIPSRGGSRNGLLYHAGRLAAYGLLGALAGSGSAALGAALPSRYTSAALSLTLAAALAISAHRLWPAERVERPLRLGLRRPRPRLGDRLFALLPKHGLALGVATALLPCGALYSAVLLAASSGTPLGGAASMLLFGALSALGLVAVSALAAKVRRLAEQGTDTLALRRVLAVTLLVGSLLFVVRPLASLTQAEPACHVER